MTINARLAKKYPLIVKWSHMMGSSAYYINQQLGLAHDTKAPEDATFYIGNGKWSTAGDIKNPLTRRTLGLPALEESE